MSIMLQRHHMATFLIDYLASFAVKKKEEYALLCHLYRFDCILQIFNMQKYILK